MSELRGRLQALTEGSESIDDVKLAGGRLFYLRRRKGETASRLFVLSPGRPERVLWSPPSGGDTSAAIAHVSPSSDGRFVGYGVATGGSEDETFFVVNVETGRNLPDRLEHLTQVSLSWVNGQEAFYYTRFPHFRDGDAGAIYTAPQAMLHRLGTPVSEDTVAISAQTDASILTDPKDIPIIVSRAGSLYLLALVYRGTSSDTAIFARPIDGKGPWAKLVGFENAVSDWALSGSSLYVIMRQNSPLGQVARLDLSHPFNPHGRPRSHGPSAGERRVNQRCCLCRRWRLSRFDDTTPRSARRFRLRNRHPPELLRNGPDVGREWARGGFPG